MAAIPFENSFASSDKAQYWAADRNGGVTPAQIAKGSAAKRHFNCQCGHQIFIAPVKINLGQWCTYCSNPPKALCDNANCGHCFDNSFASSDKAPYWDAEKNGGLTPRQVFKKTNKKYWFKCNACNHALELSLSDIHKGGWCGYCGGKKLCNDDDCKPCLDRSFASHPKAACWHPTNNGDITPRMVFKATDKKYWFICDTCNKPMQMGLNVVARGSWCLACCRK